MTTHRIKKGSWRATPNTTALRYVRNGAKWRVRFRLNYDDWAVGPMGGKYPEDFSVYEEPVPDTHIKLLGLYWAGWNVWPRMREAWRKEREVVQRFMDRPPYEGYKWKALKKALRQIPAWTHGNSARVNAYWETRPKGQEFTAEWWDKRERGVSLRTYYYLGGKGAVTTGSPVAGEEIAWLVEDPETPGWTEWGEVIFNVTDRGTGDWRIEVGEPCPEPFITNCIKVTGGQVPLPRRPWFFGLTMAHARNGPTSPVAPCDLEFEIKRVAL
jgi:hypothetical protein